MGLRDSSSAGIYAASAKGIVVFSDDSKYFTDEWLCSAVSTKANATWIWGVWPASISKGNGTIPSQPRWAPLPFCRSVPDSLPPWTGCQSRNVPWAVKNYFSFSPNIGTVHNSSFSGYNWTYQNPAQVGASDPFNVWLLCGVNGSCTDLSPLSQVAGGAWDNANFIGMVLMCLKLLYFNLLEEGMFLFRLCLFVCGLLLCLLFIRIMLIVVVIFVISYGCCD